MELTINNNNINVNSKGIKILKENKYITKLFYKYQIPLCLKKKNSIRFINKIKKLEPIIIYKKYLL